MNFDVHTFEVTIRADSKLTREQLVFILQDTLDDLKGVEVPYVKVTDPEDVVDHPAIIVRAGF